MVVPYGILDGEKEIKKKKAAIVLYSGKPRKMASLNSESKRRLNYAVKLYKKGKVDNLIFAGGFRPEILKINGSKLMAQRAKENGVPEKNIFSETKSYDTITNIKESLKIAKSNNWSKLSVIASKFHLIRTKQLIKGIDLKNDFTLNYWPYSYGGSSPYIGRIELLSDASYNLGAFILSALLPEDIYNRYVKWVRLDENENIK